MPHEPTARDHQYPFHYRAAEADEHDAEQRDGDRPGVQPEGFQRAGQDLLKIWHHGDAKLVYCPDSVALRECLGELADAVALGPTLDFGAMLDDLAAEGSAVGWWTAAARSTRSS